jgi:DNA gyrase inhibitor GyrI
LSKNINANEGTINVAELTAGTYIVKVAVGDEVKTLKVLKNKFLV